MDERAKRISEAIEKSGLSYPELERLTGISKSSLQRYATGVTKKIPIDCIEKIAEATHSDARYLMGWDTDSSGEAPTENKKDPPSADSERWERFRAKYDKLPAVEQHRIDAVLDAMLSDPADGQDQ